MEASGIIFRPLANYYGAGFRQNSQTHLKEPSLSLMGRFRDSGISMRPRKFSDEGHLRYYAVAPRCCGPKKKKDSEAAMLKKRMKMIKGLSRDLSILSDENLIQGSKGKIISEASEALLAQLQELREKEKEMKRRRKEEKAALKAARMKAMADGNTTSSSSSESSDSECGEVVDMSLLRSGALAEPKIYHTQSLQLEASISSTCASTQEKNTASSSPSIQEHHMTQVIGSSVVVDASAEKIEVCMGGKCKKSGAAVLLEEFERMVGVEGAVVGCKCMGKCRDGPNVRVLNCCNENFLEKKGDDSVNSITNPLCIGVGLEDVGAIVANFFGEKKDMGLLAAS